MKVSLRFEVFKRDRFQCGYCGRTPPDVLLEVDHILPRAAGGTDEITNLLTACWDCNRGKGSKLLEEGRSAVVSAETIENERERMAQAKAHAELLAEVEEWRRDQVDLVLARWSDRFGGHKTETGWYCETYFPEEGTVRYFLKHLSLARVFDAIDISHRRWGERSGPTPTRYFYGVGHGMIRQDRGEPRKGAE